MERLPGDPYLPPGTPSASRATVEFRCVNPECENEGTWDVAGWNELGGWFPNNDDDTNCPDCGQEGDPT